MRDGSRQILEREGAIGLARWIRSQSSVLLTDTTMRDAHQSLLATRMRSSDMIAVAESYALMVPQLLSLECWGGATFDVAMRFCRRILGKAGCDPDSRTQRPHADAAARRERRGLYQLS